MDPLTLNAGLNALGGALGGSAGPSSAAGSFMFDHSGWNVNFGDGQITSQRRETAAAAPLAALSDGLGEYLPYALAALGVLVLWRAVKR